LNCRKFRKKIRKILKHEGTPYSIALGAAIGVFWNFIPSLGIGPLLSIAVAKIVKARAAVAIAINLATGFFIPFFYTLNVITGNFITGFRLEPQEIESKLEKSLQTSVSNIGSVVDQPLTYFLLDKIQSFSVDFMVGAVINAFLAGLVIYVVLWYILKNRKKYKKQRTH